MISNLAYIHPDAKIGNNVTVEPFAYIAGDVVIGDGCWIGPGAVIHDGARIGKGCRIHTAASVSCLPQDLKFAGEVTTAEIGDYNDIREYVTISRGTASRGKTVVGDHNPKRKGYSDPFFQFNGICHSGASHRIHISQPDNGDQSHFQRPGCHQRVGYHHPTRRLG